MTKPEKTPTSGEQPAEEADLEQEALEEATLEETRAKEEQEFDDILSRLVRRTGQISFFGPILWMFVLLPSFLALATVTPPVVAMVLGCVLFLMFIAFPISAIVGLFSCLLLWSAPTTKADLKSGIVFSALADVFALGFSVILPGFQIALVPFWD
ncbi:MAG: hypothetical protein IJL92_06935 [Thermoguttaceae bacterium]|nr:hypothetical protein [Thermoguttaceae bacterium]